jgi:hypothetical protein
LLICWFCLSRIFFTANWIPSKPAKFHVHHNVIRQVIMKSSIQTYISCSSQCHSARWQWNPQSKQKFDSLLTRVFFSQFCEVGGRMIINHRNEPNLAKESRGK